jgi:hypothetical protein
METPQSELRTRAERRLSPLLLQNQFPCAAALVMTLPTLLKIEVTPAARLGDSAAAATTKNPAVRAYSTISCPLVSLQILRATTRFANLYMISLLLCFSRLNQPL